MSTLTLRRTHRARRRSTASPVSSFARFVFYLILGAVIGLGSAWYLLEQGISLDAIHKGPWILRTDAGQPVADPYTSAFIARSGHIPMRMEGALYLRADTAGDGAPLSGTCDYTVEGTALSGAWWSVALHLPDGELYENPARRHSFTHLNLVFDDSGTYRISVTPQARPGNWLPSPPDQNFVLMLRVHGPDPDYVKTPDSVPAPVIRTETCR